MNRAYISTVLLLLLLGSLLSCADKSRPSSLDGLKAMLAQRDESLYSGEVRVAWDEATAYLASAEAAFEDRDFENAERFARLGIVQTKIVLAERRIVNAREKLEDIQARKQQTELELEQTRSEIARLERSIEREQIRAHIVNVIDENRRIAAADEELRSRGLSAEDKKTISTARAVLALEMLGRAEVWLQIMRVLADAGAIVLESITSIIADVENAKVQLTQLNPVEVQRFVESAGIKAGRIWHDHGGLKLDAKLQDALTAVGIKIVATEWGSSIQIENVPWNKKMPAKITRILEAVAEILIKDPHVMVVAISSEKRLKSAAAVKRSKKRASHLAEALIKAGFPSDRVSFHGCGRAAPLVTLSGKRSHSALLILTIR